MVYYERRQNRTQKAMPQRTTLTHLPDELILEVLSNLDIDSVLKTRSVDSALCKVCNSAIKERLKVLYIFPTALSLRRAVAICESDFSEGIQEVCVLGRVLWREMLRISPYPRFDTRSTVIDTGSHYVLSDFWRWPGQMSSAKAARDAQLSALWSNGRQRSAVAFAEKYTVFLAALAKLPRFYKLSFRSSCDRPGFNMVTAEAVREHARVSLPGRAEPRSRIKGKQKPSEDPKLGNWADIHALLAILSGSKTCTSLQITEELPFVREAVGTALTNTSSALINSLERLKRLTLLLVSGSNETEWQKDMNGILALTVNLNELNLSFQHDATASKRSPQADMSLAVLFDQEETTGTYSFPRLQKLCITALLPVPENEVPYRPQLQLFDIAAFLASHASSLTSIQIDNLLFATLFSTDEDDETVIKAPVHAASQSLLDFRDSWVHGEGREFKWLVNKTVMDPRCEKCAVEEERKRPVARQVCKFACGMYAPTRLDKFGVKDVEGLFEARGVAMRQDGLAWEF